MQSKGLSRVFSNITVQKHQFFGAQPFFTVQLSQPYMTTGKTIALTRRTLVGKVMSLLLRLSHNTCEVSGQARNSFSAAYQSQSGFLWQLSPHPLQDTGSNGTLGRVLCSFTLVLSKGHVCEHAESLQSCLILCNPMDCSPPGSSVPGIL